MTDDALTRTRRALQVVPSRAGAVAPVNTAKVNDLLERVREATRPPSLRSGAAGRPSLPVASEPGKAVTTIEPSRPIAAKARELRPASLALRRGGQVPANRPSASSPELAMPDRQSNEPPPAVPVQPAAPESAPAPGPQTVYVPVPAPYWGYPWGWWGWPGPSGCLAVNCPLLRGKRCRPCGL
jgi:hypothetical protein